MAAMMRPFAPHLSQTRAPSQRLAGTLAVGVVHVLIIAGLLQATFVSMPRQRLRREIEIWFLFPPKQKEIKPGGASVPKPIPVRSLTIPDYRHIVLPPPAAEIGNLNGALFDCDPDHEATMTVDEKERCAHANLLHHDKTAVDYTDHLDLSRSAALWEQRRRRRNAPLLLPCADPHATGHMLHVDLLCAARVILGDTNPDTQTGYDSGR
jgi:hypothetical protein